MEWKKIDRFKENGLGSQVGIGKCLKSFRIVDLKEKLLKVPVFGAIKKERREVSVRTLFVDQACLVSVRF